MDWTGANDEEHFQPQMCFKCAGRTASMAMPARSKDFMHLAARVISFIIIVSASSVISHLSSDDDDMTSRSISISLGIALPPTLLPPCLASHITSASICRRIQKKRQAAR
jgi:hypothetical protein